MMFYFVAEPITQPRKLVNRPCLIPLDLVLRDDDSFGWMVMVTAAAMMAEAQYRDRLKNGP